jgi:cytochrome o ubiquinol oxidase subunit 1
MDNLPEIIFGRLTWQAFQHDPIMGGAGIFMIVALLGIVAFTTYKHKWGWLWKNWLTSLDPKKIGAMYLIVAFIMLLRGLADALMMRGQQALASGSSGYLTADHFQQIFSAHGSIMIFFVAMGVVFGAINLILPLQIGSRDVAFPKLNSISFWLFAAGMIIINAPLIAGEFSAAGWLAYPPLSELQYSPGVGVDYWIWSLQIAGIGSLMSGINFVTTIFKMRAPGMTLMKMPIFVWSVLGSMVLVMFAFPILTATLGMLSLDRLLGMHFFTAGGGGDAMMYINLIWAWGHPEVYILVLPAFGVFSEVVPVFSKKKLFGYTSMVWAIAAITLLSFTVWLHHFFTMGAGADVNTFFGIMTMIIAIPTGVKVFNWIFTMWRGRVHFTTAMWWFMAFVVTFTVGGVAGVMMSVPAADFQFHNSLFLVAHFHNMIIGGVVFGAFAGFNYWFPKFFGFKLNERIGRWSVFMWVLGFLLAFIPLYILGFMGATRRLDHYDASLGWQGLFIVAAVGVGFILLGVALQLLQVCVSIWQRKKNLDTTGGDPWDGRTLEWSLPNPPAEYNFAVIPTVETRDAFWEAKRHHERPSTDYEPIVMPENSGLGVILGGLALVFGLAIVWHIWWLVIICIVGIVVSLIVDLTRDDMYKVITTDEIRQTEMARKEAAA